MCSAAAMYRGSAGILLSSEERENERKSADKFDIFIMTEAATHSRARTTQEEWKIICQSKWQRSYDAIIKR